MFLTAVSVLPQIGNGRVEDTLIPGLRLGL